MIKKSIAVLRGGFTLFGALLVGTVPRPADAGEPASTQAIQADGHMVVEYDPVLAPLAQELVDVLNLRLGRYSIQVIVDGARAGGRSSLEETAPSAIEKDGQRGDASSGEDVSRTTAGDGVHWTWLVNLRALGQKTVIVSVDSLSPSKGISEVRTVTKESDVERMAWTIGLVVEQTVAPYLDMSRQQGALGVGLAVIEPDVVAGTTLSTGDEASPYPYLYGMGVGLSVSGVGQEEIALGPRMGLKGRLSSTILICFDVGWNGTARILRKGVSGSMSLIPMDVLLGGLFFSERHLDVIGWVGTSLGFALYQTHAGGEQRADLTFVPGAKAALEVVGTFHGSWGIFLSGGVCVFFVRDALVNNGQEIYTLSWIVPTVTLGVQLGF